MSIQKNIKYGEVSVDTFLKFGRGDIEITNGENVDHVGVMFKNSEPHEIGSDGLFYENSNDFKPEMIMIFDNENSIDVVVGELIKAKERLHNILKQV